MGDAVVGATVVVSAMVVVSDTVVVTAMVVVSATVVVTSVVWSVAVGVVSVRTGVVMVVSLQITPNKGNIY